LQFRYNLGERLSPEDGEFVVNELLKYHKNADEKIGCGLEAVKVTKPDLLQRRRPFSTTADKSRASFS
jgi:hypothetical protein